MSDEKNTEIIPTSESNVDTGASTEHTSLAIGIGELNLSSGDFAVPELSRELVSSEYDVPTLEPTSGIVELDETRCYAGKEVYLSIEGGQVVFYRGAYVTKIPLRGEPLLFGRRDVMAGHYPDVDLAMYWKQDCSISRRHLRIYSDVNGAYFVEDICGHNATYVNTYNRPLNRERMELKPGDRIFVSKSIAIVFCVR